MTDTLSSTSTATPEPRQSRRLILAVAATVATISTAAAYVAMVGFGRDLLGMSTAYAYAFAGVFELALVAVALMAREAAMDNRPNGSLLTLTWALSAGSGLFAASHEIVEGHGVVAAGFRFIVPLIAALMWHLVLVGDRHLSAGRSWSQLRTAGRMHGLFIASKEVERLAREHAEHNTKRTLRRLARAEARERRAESVALRTVPPEDMRAETTTWSAALEAVAEGKARVRQLHHGTAQLPATITVEQLVDAGDKLDQLGGQVDAGAQLQALPAPRPQVAEITAERPVVATAAESPAEEPAGATAAPEAAQPAQEDSPRKEEQDRPRLAAVPAAPKRQSTAPAKTSEKVTKACELRDQGKPVDEIAAQLGASKRTVYRWFEKVDAAGETAGAAEAS
ncbi:helix-turn-helix domain-containing protein [Nocardioides sp. NPDC006273]|uniref:helix-turn-helix domain-containing protein n=1 Tax=Nocardioides sp. NPDC006273 TaxID=3155598 RepID=UPI0033AC38C1